MRLPKCIRYFRLIYKIHSKLPKYHPETGERLCWCVGFIKRGVSGYDVNNGCALGKTFQTFYIDQKSPSRSSMRVYKYNWKKKKIEIVKNALWS